MDSYVTLLSFAYPQDAYILQGRLESEDIECFLKDENIVQVDSFATNAYGGVKLQVKESDFARATEIMKEAGYLKEKDFQPTPFWKRMDSYTSGIPLLKSLPLEIRAMFVLGGSVLLVIGLVLFALGGKAD
jgi:hypothetical protein